MLEIGYCGHRCLNRFLHLDYIHNNYIYLCQKNSGINDISCRNHNSILINNFKCKKANMLNTIPRFCFDSLLVGIESYVWQIDLWWFWSQRSMESDESWSSKLIDCGWKHELLSCSSRNRFWHVTQLELTARGKLLVAWAFSLLQISFGAHSAWSL